MKQASLFEAEASRGAEDQQCWLWREVWGWDGPTVGGFCEVGTPIVPTPDGGNLYCYTEQCRLIEQLPDGQWLAEIAMGEVRGEPWPKDGRRVILGITDIAAPRQWLRQQRLEAQPE